MPMMLTSSTETSFVATRHRNLGTSDAVGASTPSLTHLHSFPDHAEDVPDHGHKIPCSEKCRQLAIRPRIVGFPGPFRPHQSSNRKNSLFFSLLAGNSGVETGSTTTASATKLRTEMAAESRIVTIRNHLASIQGWHFATKEQCSQSPLQTRQCRQRARKAPAMKPRCGPFDWLQTHSQGCDTPERTTRRTR